MMTNEVRNYSREHPEVTDYPIKQRAPWPRSSCRETLAMLPEDHLHTTLMPGIEATVKGESRNRALCISIQNRCTWQKLYKVWCDCVKRTQHRSLTFTQSSLFCQEWDENCLARWITLTVSELHSSRRELVQTHGAISPLSGLAWPKRAVWEQWDGCSPALVLGGGKEERGGKKSMLASDEVENKGLVWTLLTEKQESLLEPLWEWIRSR